MTEETIFGKWYHKWISKWIPEYGVLLLLGCGLFNNLIYWGSQQLMHNAHHYDLTTDLDRKIPFTKEWILIYTICFAFWAFNYILVSREDKETWYRFGTADLMSRVICGFFFIVLPTTNIRPQVLGNDFCSWLVRFIYQTDAPTNLFPSIHCMVSWYCFLGIRKSKKIPMWYKIFSFVFAILVCASTQFTKQHYLVDVVGGILIAQLCYFISSHTNLYLGVERIFGWIGQRIFGVKHYDE
jgi:membrane-associated phospholipid phosphatase